MVVPLLLSTGRVAGQIPEVLKGLTFAWDGKPLLPDDRIADWILDETASVDGNVRHRPDAAETVLTITGNTGHVGDDGVASAC